MKLFFHKTEYYGHWFDDDENPDEFTEKVPLNTGYIFDENLNDWILQPIVKNEEQKETE
jgi:hypothetical protein